jgi:hypothetical protein
MLTHLKLTTTITDSKITKVAIKLVNDTSWVELTNIHTNQTVRGEIAPEYQGLFEVFWEAKARLANAFVSTLRIDRDTNPTSFIYVELRPQHEITCLVEDSTTNDVAKLRNHFHLGKELQSIVLQDADGQFPILIYYKPLDFIKCEVLHFVSIFVWSNLMYF